jgi:hypothetical protein
MLPLEWIDKLFLKLAIVYGVDIAKRYSGLDPAAVKTEWANCLSGFRDRPDAIKFALDHLPSDRCPTMLQFRDICRQCPPPSTTALPEPKADKVVVTKEMAKLVQQAFTNRDPKLWAKKLKKRHEAGKKLSLIQIKLYTEVLNG